MKGKIAFIAIACLIFAGCIGPVNENPRAKMSVDKTIVFVGDEITFNASKSKDPEGSKLVYIWNFGDTKTEEGSDLKITKHKYDGDGIYNVVLRVKDDKGAKSSPVNSTVIVAPLPKASESKVLTYTNITFS
ncbi:MAG: PKD domain-containing protein, partial [Candidatus Thermoplasmatota archaeon]